MSGLVRRESRALLKDPAKEYEENCKNCSKKGEKFIWLCFDCQKFSCTKCYAKDHKRCWADLVENMYDDLKKTNENNLETVISMKNEFIEEAEFMEKKFSTIEDNNPFDNNIALIEKIFEDIRDVMVKKREETLNKMNALRDNYMKNIQQNIHKIRHQIDRSNEVEDGLQNELKLMEKLDPFAYCKTVLMNNKSADLADDCSEISLFQSQDFTRIKHSFIDTNTIVFNDSNQIIEQCRNFREYITDKVQNFYGNYAKYEDKYAFTVVMNQKEFIVYLIDSNKVTKVSYMNDFNIPGFARWIEISGDKLILTGGEKDCIESLNSTYMFKFRKYDGTDEGFSAKVYHRADMLYRRRAHSLIYFNDFIYAVSGVDKLEMIKKCEKYDIFKDKWIHVPELNYPRQNTALAIYNQRYLYAFCGYDGHRNVDSFEKLDFLNEDKGK